MASVDVLGVKGGDICDCDCDRMDCVPREDDWRLCPNRLTRDRFGDLCMFNGATTALECLSMTSWSVMYSAMSKDNMDDGGFGRRGGLPQTSAIWASQFRQYASRASSTPANPKRGTGCRWVTIGANQGEWSLGTWLSWCWYVDVVLCVCYYYCV